MPQLIWTGGALRDLDRLHAFLAAKNPRAARSAISAIRSATRTLERHPLIGRSVEDSGIGLRELTVAFGSGGYVLLYRPDTDRIVILAARHGREDKFT